MAGYKSKKLTGTEFDVYLEKSSDWSNRARLDDSELAAEMGGVPKMSGYVATFFSGSFADPEGSIVGSCDAIREDTRFSMSDRGRFKKYQFKIYVTPEGDPRVLTVKEKRRSKVSKHHMTKQEFEDDFLAVTLTSRTGSSSP